MLEKINQIGMLPIHEFRTLCFELKDDEDALQDLLYYRFATDLELFTLHFFAHFCKHPFNPFHYETFQDNSYGQRRIRRARAAPRGYAKSTIKALVKPIHDLCYGLEKFIVIFSNGESQALGKLKDIRNELLSNTPLVDFYNIRFPSKTVAAGSFEVFAGDHACKFEAYGTGSQVRGIRYGSARPTKLVFDDVEHSEEVENEEIRQKYFNWYHEDVVKIGDETTNIEFIGTILHRRSLLQDLIDNPMYDTHVYKAVISWSERQDLWEEWKKILLNLELPKEQRLIESRAYYASHEKDMLQGVEVLWPEKEPYLALMEELVESGRRAFMKEKQNEPIGTEEKVFTRFHWYKETEKNGEKGVLIEDSNVFIPLTHMRAYGALDPATGQTKAKSGKKGDFTSLLTGLVDPKGRLFVHRDWTKRAPPSVFIEQIFLHHQEWEYEKFGVETNLYRNLLMPNIIASKKKIEEKTTKLMKLPLYDIETVENKEKRIYSLEPKITNGYILLNRALSQEAFNQLDDFPKGSHDDFPDCLEMLFNMAFNRYRMKAVDVNAMGGS